MRRENAHAVSSFLDPVIMATFLPSRWVFPITLKRQTSNLITERCTYFIKIFSKKRSLFAHFFESFLPGRDLSITRWMRMCVEEMESFCYNSDENEIIGNNRGRGNAQIQWVLSPHFVSHHSCSARELTADQSSLTINQSSSFSFVYNDTVCVCMFVDLQHVPKKNNNRIHLIYDQQLNSHQQFIYDYR